MTAEWLTAIGSIGTLVVIAATVITATMTVGISVALLASGVGPVPYTYLTLPTNYSL